jgi:tetratricopeptide (TPR) repeat protein
MANELSKLSNYYDRKTALDMDYRGYMEKQAMVKDIGTAIQRSTDQQVLMNAIVGTNITSHIDQSAERMEHSINKLGHSMVKMQTGIQFAIHNQTFAIIASQAALARTFQQGFDKVNNTLDMGFSGISNQLGSMTAAFSSGIDRVCDNIKKMSKDICDRLDAIHDIVNNPLLTQSRELYRRSVINYNKGFYEEALEDIKTAVEKNKTDYISWFLLGKLYLFGASEFSNIINLEKAVEALTNAAKYNKPDITTSEDGRLMAAEIYFYIGLANYNLFNDLYFRKLEDEAKTAIAESLKAYEQSWNYSENMLEALYNIARCKAIMGKTEDALKDIETVINGDRGYCVKITDDSDFASISDSIFKLIEKLKNEMYPKAKADFDTLKQKLDVTVFLGGFFANMVKKLVEDWVPETFTENLTYYDVRDGYEMFSVILGYLNIEEYPCDRLVAELEPKDCPYNNYTSKNEHDHLAIFSKLYDNALVCWNSSWERSFNEKIDRLKEKYRITEHGYPRFLKYQYDNIIQQGKIEFIPPTEEALQNIKCVPPDIGKSFNPSQHYSNRYFVNFSVEYEKIPERALINMNNATATIFEGPISTKVKNINEYNCSKWNISINWNKNDFSLKQEIGIAYKENENIFIPLFEIKIKATPKGDKNIIQFNSPYIFFQNKETLILFVNDIKKKNEPIKVFQPGIISKSAFAEIEQKAKQKEDEARRKAEAEVAAKLEAEEAYRKTLEERKRWAAQGLCLSCGGAVGGLFTKKCKVCGMEQ